MCRHNDQIELLQDRRRLLSCPGNINVLQNDVSVVGRLGSASAVILSIFSHLFVLSLGLLIGAITAAVILGNLAAFIVLSVNFLIMTIVTVIYRRMRF